MHTMASNGKMLRDKNKAKRYFSFNRNLHFDNSIPRLPFHKVDHVYDARRADHGLVRQDGSHGLFHAELRPQRREKRLDLFPAPPEHQRLGLASRIKSPSGNRSSMHLTELLFNLKPYCVHENPS